MINEWFKSNKGLAVKVAVEFFILCLILAVIGVLMQGKMNSLLNSLTEQAIARQTADFSLLAEERFNRELSELAMTARFLENNSDRLENTLGIMENQRPGTFYGLLSRDRGAVAGLDLNRHDFRLLRDAFGGKRVVDYCAGKGLLFAVPVFRGDNVRYVLYRLYEEKTLTAVFGLSEYDSDSRILIRERGGNIIVPYADFATEDKKFFQDETIQAGFNQVQKELASNKSVACYSEGAQGKYFLFGADLPQTNCSMIGYIPWEAAAGGVSRIYDLVLTVVTLMLLLFAAASVYMFLAQSRAAESDALRESAKIAKHASEAKSKFLASMSHEIRTPINAVLGMNELILRESREDNVRSYAQNIAGAGQALLSLINDILDFSKIESGRMELIAAPYRLTSLLHDTVSIIEPRAMKKGLEFHVDVDNSLADTLLGDAVRIRQIMLNLLTNAVKYTPQGQVSFSVRSLLSDGDKLLMEISVKDTGIGIRDEDREKLFTDFERFDAVKNSNIEGTGLGLAITKKLIELMEGTVEVESVYGQGSTFRVHLPQKIVNAAPIGNFIEQLKKNREVEVYRGEFIAPGAKIMIVDDNEMNLMVAQGLLKTTQAQITLCTGGAQCLERMAAEHYDVIFLDHMMPEMDGLETLAEAHRLENNQCKDTPIIALTANAVQGAKEMFLTAGFNDYISKPVSGKTLEQMLKKYLPPEKISTAADARGAVEEYPKTEDADEATDELPLVDRTVGLEYSGGMTELYDELTAVFCKLKDAKKKELEREFADEDWQNYTIHIHALKSTAKTIGCMPLSEAARALEMAGRVLRSAEASEEEKADHLNFIRANHAAAMELYDKTASAVAESSLK